MSLTHATRDRSARWLALAAMVVLQWACIAPAQAQFATGGTGLHRGRIFWVDWGNNGENVYAGRTITRGFNVGTPATPANRLDITCTLSNATTPRGTSGLSVYAPGTWQGDGLDELYNIGGNQPGQGANPNTLTVGLATNGGSTVAFDFSCSATLGGAPFALSGLVFADAEASGGSEYVAADLTSGGTLRVIDQIAQCRGGDPNVRSTVTITGTEVRFSGPTAASNCENNGTPSLRAGPALVGFIDGALSARVSAYGGGKSAVAVGAVIDLEFSEAIPTSYGSAAHVLNANWTGGVAAAGVDFNNPANLATVVPGPRLGATVQPDADANGAIGGPDVDALPKTTGPAGNGYANVPPPNSLPGTTYTIANIACTGPASVAGWIDFNGNGSFGAAERSNTASCPAGSGTVSLTWTIPNNYAPQATSYLRLRLSPNAAGIADPEGVASNGEAEDYRLALPQLVPTVTLAKVSTGGVGSFAFNGTNGVGTQNLITTAPGTPVSGSPRTLTTAGAATTISEGVAANFVLTGINCTGLGAGGTATVDLALRRVTLDAAATAVGSAITCTFANAASADLQIAKTNTPAAGSNDQADDILISGTTTTYDIVVRNAGPAAVVNAVLTDPAPTGLTNCTLGTPACAVTLGTATCPTVGSGAGQLSIANLQSAGGVLIPSMANGSAMAFKVTCTVP